MVIEGTYLNIIMTMYSKPTANIILTCENLKGSPLRLGIIKGCPFSPLFNIVLEVLAMAERKKKRKKERKGIQIEKDAIKISLLQMT